MHAVVGESPLSTDAKLRNSCPVPDWKLAGCLCCSSAASGDDATCMLAHIVTTRMVAINKWQQLKLLTWKNFVLQKRRPWDCVFEIDLPMLFFLIMIVVRRLMTINNRPDIAYSSQPVSPLDYGRLLSNNFAPTGTMGTVDADIRRIYDDIFSFSLVIFCFRSIFVYVSVFR